MKTVIADTNIFLRFLTNDVPSQAALVEKRFRQAQSGKLKLRILPITIVEILFHLEKWYKHPKTKAVEKIQNLFSPAWMEVDDKDVIFEALCQYEISNIDFVDILTWSCAKKSKERILSFDKDFDKLNPKLRLNP
jgi:predicted nucleic-acid-binding protein